MGAWVDLSSVKMALVKPLFILLILPFLVLSLADQNEASRSSNCQDSEPFLIKNRAAKAKKPYLTVNLKTNAVNGGKRTEKVNQQWMWRDCDTRRTLVNVTTASQPRSRTLLSRQTPGSTSPL